ncbi:hypothetical protein E8E13_005190 [Curvularia kusanoi]|uniref:Uncharacterized protein n=1 Tax=Curvularia kusanoi TaxID=90978 RepID=A0A9P4TBZ7_CURKU|nr:hypothetical protein E8E13_005190 [Curvularia kusanoi]
MVVDTTGTELLAREEFKMGAFTNNGVAERDVLQSIVYTLLDVFDATRDLYQTLTAKDKREVEFQMRAKGFSGTRQLEYLDDAEVSGKRGILTDKLAVLRRYEDGLRDAGDGFAIGDALSHVSLQSEVIRLQGLLLTTFLYGPTSEEPLQQQLAKIDAASNVASTAAVDVLDAFQVRLQAEVRASVFPGSRRGSLRAGSMPGSFIADDEPSTAMVSYREPPRVRAGSPVNTTIITKGPVPAPSSSDTRSLISRNPPSEQNDGLYCPYALSLERHRSQQLSPSITTAETPFCPDCKRTLHLSPGKAWEILKKDTGYQRCFQISTRFVVKCHRPGPDAGYACIICSRAAGDDVTVCGDVKALVKHMCEDHGSRELKAEEDITEVVELGARDRDRERDGGAALGYSTSRGSRRSASVASRRSRRRGSVGLEREVEAVEIRVPRRM